MITCRMLCLSLAVLPACSSTPEAQLAALQLPPETQQVILCTSSSWDATAATLRCFQRAGDGWRLDAPSIPARVGENGLGWGLGLHADGTGPSKHEGDKRAPAGIYRLGTAFGYAKQQPDGVTMPYRTATDRDYFVDAADSAVYNQWQHIPAAEPNDPNSRWASCERMRRDDAVYEFGMVVNHNTESPVPGRGSAIFLHVWGSPETATSGCTAMSRDDLLRLLRWLQPQAQPLLVQVPAAELSTLRTVAR